MRLKILYLFSLTALAAISGCSRASLPLNNTPSPTPEQAVTVIAATPTVYVDPVGVDAQELDGASIKLWHAWRSPQRELLEAYIAEFNTENPWGITVRAEPYEDETALIEAVNAALEAGDPPELVAALPEAILAWDAEKAITDLSPYISHPAWGLTADELADIPEVVWQQDQADDRHLALPAERAARLLFYNQTWAGELGFSAPPENADEFREQACAANAFFKSDKFFFNDGYGGWIVDTDRQTVLSWLDSFDGEVFTNGEYTFENEKNSDALAFLKGLLDNNCAWIYTGEEYEKQFIDRTALFIASDISDIGYQQQLAEINQSNDEWTVMGFPGQKDSSIVVYGPSYAVMATSPKEQLAAYLFAKSMLEPEKQAQWVNMTGLIPLRESALDSLKAYRAEHPQWAAAIKLLPEAVVEPQLASWRTVKYVLADGANTIFRYNIDIKDIPATLELMQKTAEDLSE